MSLKNLLISPLANGIFKKQEFYGKGVRLVNVYDLYQDTEINISTLERIETTDKELEQFQVQEGDLFFCRSSLKPEGVAWTSYINEVTEPTVFECHLVRAKPNPLQVIPAYLSHYCRSSLARDYLIARASVTTMATIDQSAIESLPIILPPIEIQQALVAQIEAARQARKQKLAQADELLFNLNECFVEGLGLTHAPQPDSTKVRCFAIKRTKIEPRLDCQFYFAEHYYLEESLKKTGFPVLKLGNQKISQSVVDGPFGSQLKVEEYQESGIPLIRVSNCRSGKIFDDGELVYISEEKHQQLIRSEVLPGDVLLTKAGHILGYAAVFPENLVKGNITSHLASIRPSQDVIPEFLAAYLRSYWGNVQIYRWGNKATRPELNTDEVRQILVPLPPKDIQQSLVIEIEKRRADAQRLRQEAEAEWEAAKTRFERKLLGEES